MRALAKEHAGAIMRGQIPAHMSIEPHHMVSGLPSAAASVLAAFDPTLRQPPIPISQSELLDRVFNSPGSPGPLAKAMPSMRSIDMPGSLSAL